MKSVVDNGIEDQAVTHKGWPPEFEHVNWLQDGVWTTEAAETESQRERSKHGAVPKAQPGWPNTETGSAGPERSWNYTDLLHVSMFSSKIMSTRASTILIPLMSCCFISNTFYKHQLILTAWDCPLLKPDHESLTYRVTPYLTVSLISVGLHGEQAPEQCKNARP